MGAAHFRHGSGLPGHHLPVEARAQGVHLLRHVPLEAEGLHQVPRLVTHDDVQQGVPEAGQQRPPLLSQPRHHGQ